MTQPDQQQFKALQDAARFPDMNPGPVLRLDRDGTVLLANRAAREVFGDGIAGGSWHDLCPEVTGPQWTQVLESAESFSVESSVGDREYVFTHRSDAEAGLVFVFGSDVTELKEAQKTVREIARFPDMNPGPVLRLDMAGSVLLSNRAARTVFGKDLDGLSWPNICPALKQSDWRRITGADGLVTVESIIEGRNYLFAHRRDSVTELVFVYGADITEQRRLEEELRQTEKMAALGKLSAGLAHELNNPAAAAGRASAQIMEAVSLLQQATTDLAKMGLSTQEWDDIDRWERAVRDRHVAAPPMSALDMSDREEELLTKLEAIDFPAPWEAAPVLAGAGFTVHDVDELLEALSPDAVSAVLVRSCRGLTVSDLADVLSRSSSSISTLVGAVKSYSYMDRAPVQNADIHKGLEDTITILRHKLKKGVTVVRDFDRSIPVMQINGSELNQVWTNLIDNAADAMDQQGTLTIRTSQSNGKVVVEVGDNGRGIPDDVRARVFEPFFTTKDVGQGTGLGLDIARRIVNDRSGGKISFTSRPGETIFRVELPLHSVTP